MLLGSGICCLVSPWFFRAFPPVFLAFMLAWGCLVAEVTPQFITLVARSAPRELAGTSVTFANCLGFSMTIVSLQLTAYAAEILPARYVFLLLTFGPVVGVISVVPLMRKDG